MTTINGTKFTDNEIKMLWAFFNESMDCCGSFDEFENMSWMSAPDLVEVLGQSKESVAGTMSSLESKGAIQNSGESARGDKAPDWTMDDRLGPWFHAQVAEHTQAVDEVLDKVFQDDLEGGAA